MLSGFVEEERVLEQPEDWAQLREDLRTTDRDGIEEASIDIPDERIGQLFNNPQEVEDQQETRPGGLVYRIFLHESVMGERRCLGGLFEPHGRNEQYILDATTRLQGKHYTGTLRHFLIGFAIQSDA